MKKLFILVLVCVGTFATAQTNSYHKGLFGLTECRYMLGIEQRGDYYPLSGFGSPLMYTFSLRGGLGYYISPYFSAGIGTGFDVNKYPDISTLPVLVDIRFYLMNKPNTPFAYVEAGPHIPIEDAFSKGFTAEAGIGYKYMFKRHFGINATVSWVFKTFGDGDHSRRQSLSFGIGFIF